MPMPAPTLIPTALIIGCLASARAITNPPSFLRFNGFSMSPLPLPPPKTLAGPLTLVLVLAPNTVAFGTSPTLPPVNCMLLAS